MGFPVLKLDKTMNVREFLEWDSGDDRVWELHDGYPILKDGWGPRGHAAPTPRHNAMVGELARLIGNALRGAGLSPGPASTAIPTGAGPSMSRTFWSAAAPRQGTGLFWWPKSCRLPTQPRR